jgi:hypothetical protein
MTYADGGVVWSPETDISLEELEKELEKQKK